MAKPRVLQPGGIYHFGSRGSNRGLIYLDDVDYGSWQRLLARVCRRRGWTVLSFTQMPNHFHVLARVPDCSLSVGMQELNSVYSRSSNARHGRNAHLFENRFWSELVESQEQLLTTIGYIDVNSYKSARRIHPRAWRFGSHRGIAGYAEAPSFVAVDEVLRLFAPKREVAVARYREFVGVAMARVDMTRAQTSVTELSRRAS